MSDFPCDFRDSARVEEIIDKLASTPLLFVVSDFDGTLAEHSTDIYGVPVNQYSIAALSAFAKLPIPSLLRYQGATLKVSSESFRCAHQ